jgi:hypothetical protein
MITLTIHATKPILKESQILINYGHNEDDLREAWADFVRRR